MGHNIIKNKVCAVGKYPNIKKKNPTIMEKTVRSPKAISKVNKMSTLIVYGSTLCPIGAF